MPIDNGGSACVYDNALASSHRGSSLPNQSVSNLDDLKFYMPVVTSSTNAPRYADFDHSAPPLAAIPEGAQPTTGFGDVQGVHVFDTSSMGADEPYQDMLGHVTGWSV